MRDHVNRLLSDIQQTSTRSSLALDDQNVCSLMIDDDLECNIELDEADEWLYIFSPFMRPPEDGLLDFLASVLRANLFGLDTEGGHLGLCDQSGWVVYCRRYKPQSLDEIAFRKELDAVVATVRDLRDAFSRAPGPTGSDKPDRNTVDGDKSQNAIRV